MLKPFGELRSVSAEAGGVQGGSSAAGSSGAAALRASSSLPAGSAAPRGGGADQSFVFAEFYDSRCAKQALETLQIDGMVLPGSPPRASVGEGGAAAAAPPAGVAGPGAGAAGRTGNAGGSSGGPDPLSVSLFDELPVHTGEDGKLHAGLGNSWWGQPSSAWSPARGAKQQQQQSQQQAQVRTGHGLNPLQAQAAYAASQSGGARPAPLAPAPAGQHRAAARLEGYAHSGPGGLGASGNGLDTVPLAGGSTRPGVPVHLQGLSPGGWGGSGQPQEGYPPGVWDLHGAMQGLVLGGTGDERGAGMPAALQQAWGEHQAYPGRLLGSPHSFPSVQAQAAMAAQQASFAHTAAATPGAAGLAPGGVGGAEARAVAPAFDVGGGAAYPQWGGEGLSNGVRPGMQGGYGRGGGGRGQSAGGRPGASGGGGWGAVGGSGGGRGEGPRAHAQQRGRGLGRRPPPPGPSRRGGAAPAPGTGQTDAAFDGLFRFDSQAARQGTTAEGARTTVMVRNIPNKYNQKMLLEMLDQHSGVLYNFFYLPIDFKNRCNLGYAFINFTSSWAAADFYDTFHNRKWPDFNSRKVCAVTYARVQGRESLIQHFRNSRFPCNDVSCLPLLFDICDAETGEPRPLPAPEPGQEPKRGLEPGLRIRVTPIRSEPTTPGSPLS